MNYEILTGILSLYSNRKSCKRYAQIFDGLYELLFLYNYAWIEIDESWDVVPWRPKYDYPPGRPQLWCHRASPRAA